ncbi:IclR family transcriptional regulator [Kutzneria sp. NPDC052558]|uniref:IclR family transcriptional regulator n=1 Tax=Kutzneria sp. NPDC052558 TaxID=3364121 RepID=UPI0037C6768F
MLAVLHAVRDHAAPITSIEVARETGLPRSTAHRLLTELESHGAVRRQGDGYRLGAAITRLVTDEEDEPTRRIRHALKPTLAAVYERTHYLVGLAVSGEPGAPTVRFIDIVCGDDHRRVIDRIERQSALHVSAAGRTLLAFDPELRAGFTAVNSDALDRELSRIRLHGVALGVVSPGLDIAAAAVPVFGSGPVAALSIGTRGDRFDLALASGILRHASAHARRVLRGERPTAQQPSSGR